MDEVLIRAGIFQGVEPFAADAELAGFMGELAGEGAVVSFVGVARERIQKDATWTYEDWGVRAMGEEDVRARLREQGYARLADDPAAPAAIKRAADAAALAVWTDEHLVTIDASRLDERPGR